MHPLEASRKRQIESKPRNRRPLDAASSAFRPRMTSNGNRGKWAFVLQWAKSGRILIDAMRRTSEAAEQRKPMAVIDIHAHIYPDKIADRAAQSVGEFYGVGMHKGGSVEELFEAAATSPITHFGVHSVAIKPSNVEHINDFIAEQCRIHPEFIGFATLHQDFPDPEAEIERILGLGLHGLKLHPDTQMVNIDDPRLMRIYEIIEGRLPLILHTGDYRYDYSHPRRLKKVLHAFPNLVVDAAHFGGWSIFDLAVEYLEDENCFLDMSSSQPFLGLRRTRELVHIYGTDRILFGSDFPMWSPAKEYEDFASLGFTETELENMTWHNAERFLGMKVE